MVIVNFPYPRYIAVMDDSLIAKTLSNTRKIQVLPNDINQILLSLISTIRAGMRHSN